MGNNKKDSKAKAAEELAKLLTEEELQNAVLGARALRDPERNLDSPLVSNNGHETFREAENREVIFKDEAKINMTKYITKPDPGIRNIMPITEIPGTILMDIVEGIHIDEMLDPLRRQQNPTETPEENEYSLFCYAMKGFNRKGLKEFLQLGEMEAADRGLGDNLTPEVRQ